MNDQNLALAVRTTRSTNSKLTGWFHSRRWFLLFVGLPTLLAIVYYGLIASDQYMSQSRFVIKSPSQKQSQMSTLANLIQTTGLSSGQEQTNEVLDYLRSRNALVDLQKRTNVRAAFGMPDIDALSRYPAPFKDDRFENLFKYYGSKVETRLDNDSGLAILEVRAFTSGDARAINAELLGLSEALVNRLNDRSRLKAIAEGERRVAGAEARMRRARAALGVFRNSTELIDPAKQAVGVYDVSNKLIAEQAGLKAQLDLMQRVTPRNPNIPSLRGRVAAIGAAIAAQNGRAVGGSGAIASNLGNYENLSLEQEFASQMLTAANASLEQSRSEAQKQQFYLERVVEPNAPDLALYPNRLIKILTIAAAALALYLIGWMLVVGILEHAPEK
ncbi:capsule biosynthesis protein [Sphingomonas qilianensis]|uniref:Capsule biosynthesis protein n=1 Tax=Sphingomonas qilianensis TaxID=1736690 RepID=A0ABU9XTS3_9SPHN